MIKNKLTVNNHQSTRERGVTIFIAVVIMSILLFVSFAALNIAIKGSIFSTSGRDSQLAFYAADSGVECAIYADSKFDPSKFSTSTAGSITCASQTISGGQAISGTSTLSLIGGGSDANQTSIFGITLNTGSNPLSACAIVTVRKYYTGQTLNTYIKSRGYNTCDTTNPRRIERGIEVTY